MFKEITTIDDWQDTLSQSTKKPVIVYKHSDTCHISAEAKKRIKDCIADGTIKDSVYVVTIQTAKEVSDKIEYDTGLKHESPQLIIIKEKEVLYFANHYDINAVDIKEYMSDEK